MAFDAWRQQFPGAHAGLAQQSKQQPIGLWSARNRAVKGATLVTRGDRARQAPLRGLRVTSGKGIVWAELVPDGPGKKAAEGCGATGDGTGGNSAATDPGLKRREAERIKRGGQSSRGGSQLIAVGAQGLWSEARLTLHIAEKGIALLGKSRRHRGSFASRQKMVGADGDYAREIQNCRAQREGRDSNSVRWR
jgi:hypothetical protein